MNDNIKWSPRKNNMKDILIVVLTMIIIIGSFGMRFQMNKVRILEEIIMPPETIVKLKCIEGVEVMGKLGDFMNSFIVIGEEK